MLAISIKIEQIKAFTFLKSILALKFKQIVIFCQKLMES